MQAMIDHTAAVVIGATILFILLALSVRSNDSSIEATQIDLAKTELRTLIDVIEQDFNNMGGGMGDPNLNASERVITSAGTQNVGGNTYETVTFRTLQDDTGAPVLQTITYRWRQDGTAALPDGTVVDLYEVERESNAGLPGSHKASFTNVSVFDIVLRYDNYRPVVSGLTIPDSLTAVRYIDLDIGMIPPVGSEALIQQTRWAKRFRPKNLEPLDRSIIASPP